MDNKGLMAEYLFNLMHARKDCLCVLFFDDDAEMRKSVENASGTIVGNRNRAKSAIPVAKPRDR